MAQRVENNSICWLKGKEFASGGVAAFHFTIMRVRLLKARVDKNLTSVKLISYSFPRSAQSFHGKITIVYRQKVFQLNAFLC